MKYLVNVEEMQRADENTISCFGVPQLVLMERAALSARDFIVRRWPEFFAESRRILIALGNGNNGGDGAALARLFCLQGHRVTVFVSGNKEKYSPALKMQMDILEQYRTEMGKTDGGSSAGCAPAVLTDAEWLPDHGRTSGQNGYCRDFAGYDLVVDALFGIGLSRPIEGIWKDKIEWLNKLPGKKAALDIPSGVSARDGSVSGAAFRADLTVTFGFLKTGMLLYPGKELCGEIKTADIGITVESFLGKYPAGITIDRPAGKSGPNGRADALFSRRKQNSHKGSFGKVLLFAGSAETPGAALLAGESVLRSGAGMLQLVSPAENREIVLTKLPEAMYRTLTVDTDWEKMLCWCDAAVIGPGIGQSGLAAESLERILTLLSEKGMGKPLVLDADGLNLTASSEKLYGLVKKYTALGGIVIMTPHMAELARLLHCDMRKLQENRLEKTEQYVRESGVILIGKDAVTVVEYTDEKDTLHYYVNQTGNSGMATAGSGDVLSGITGALAVAAAVELRESDSLSGSENAYVKEIYFRAACKAVYLHGFAGDRAAEKYGEISMKAGDITAELPELFSESVEPDRAC